MTPPILHRLIPIVSFLLLPGSLLARDTVVVFNEIHYHPAGRGDPRLEFVELYNQNSVDIDLSGWRLSGGIDFNFPAGTVIAGGGYLVIAADPAALMLAGGPAGTLGPFGGMLDNGGEGLRLRNNNDRIMDGVDYDDRPPWPVGADGSGASLAKIEPRTRSDGAEYWTHSLEMGGTPGAVNFADTGESSEGLPLWINEVAGGEDGSFWLELYNAGDSTIDLEGFVLAFEDAGEYVFPAAVELAAGDWLLIPSTTLALPSDPKSGENVSLYQSGKVFLLDAVRIDDLALGRVPDGSADMYTIGLPADQSPGTANTVTLRSEIVINEIMYHHPPQYAREPDSSNTVGGIGWNAIWRYNESGEDLGSGWASGAHPVGGNWKSGAGPLGYETNTGNPPEPIVTLLPDPRLRDPQVITYYFETEFEVNAEDLPKVTQLRFSHEIDDGAVFYLNGEELVPRYDMPSGTVTASTLAINTTSPEAEAIRFFSVAPTDLVAGTNRVSVEVHQASTTSSDIVMGLRLDLETASGTLSSIAYAESSEEWIEFYNRSGGTVDLSGWKLDDAVSYTFPSGTEIQADSYLVVARDYEKFVAKFPGVPVVGDFSGSLSNRGERLLLLDPFGNPADEVAYVDDRPWPSAADGGGSSLELRHPEVDNGNPASWAASDNSATAPWRHYEYVLKAHDLASWNSPGQFSFHEIRLGLLDEGELLIDDFSVVEDPNGQALELIANGSFDTASGWRLLGTHQESAIVDDGGDRVLKIVASDRFNYLNNLIEANLTSGGSLRPVQDGVDYRIRFRAKWLSGSPQFRFEFYYNKLAKLVILEQPAFHGTPGARNSVYTTALGPSLSDLVHSPAVPSSGEAIAVSVRASDPDGIGAMSLKYAVNAGAFRSVAMTPEGGNHWTAMIPGQANDTLVQFYVEARDASASGNLAYAPVLGPDSRALIRIASPNGGNLKESIRINMLTAEANAMHSSNDILSNHRFGCTLIVNEKEISYDAGIRLRGSMFSRNARNTTGLNLKFPADRRYRGLHSTVTVRTENRHEILVKHIINAAGGIHDNYNDIVQLNGYASGPNGRARLEMARFGRVYLDGLPGGNGRDGTVFKMEGIREFQATQDGSPNTPKRPFPIGWVASFDLADQGDDKEIYRHNIRINTALERDDYRRIIEMCRLFSLSEGAIKRFAPGVIDADRWTRQFAMLSLCGINDTYSQGNPHNLNFYVRPDGIVESMPWDWDFIFNRPTNAPLWGNRNVSKLFELPVYTRLFHGHLYDIINTTYNAGYLTDWFNHLGTCAGENYGGNIAYVTARANYVLSQLPGQIPFAVTTNGGQPMTTTESAVLLSGDGWIDVRTVTVDGFPDPFPLVWADGDSWRISIPVALGENVLTLRALNHQGDQVGSDTITVTNIGTVEPANATNLAISEIMYHPAGNAAEEYIEITNISGTGAEVDLSGVAFTDGIEFSFPPGSRLAAGNRILVVQDEASFASRYGASMPVAGVFGNGSRLANSGERIRLEGAGGTVIQDFVYDDVLPWPEAADGLGYSMVLINPQGAPDHSDPFNWRASVSAGGNPAASDATRFVGDPNADDNGNGISNFMEYALGGEGGGPALDVDSLGHLELRYSRNLAADDVQWAIERSTDLLVWEEDNAFELLSVSLPQGGNATFGYRSHQAIGPEKRLFIRLKAQSR